MKQKNDDCGQELILDLDGCDIRLLKSKTEIRNFVRRLCRLIEMKRYGETIIERFGSRTSFGEGYSFLQFIETSSITGHLLEINGKAFFNIFSCRRFDADKVIKFSVEFFKAKKVKNRILFRR